MSEENITQMILNLIMKSSVISFKIYDYTEEDIKTIKELYEKGVFVQYDQNFFKTSCTCWIDIYRDRLHNVNWQKFLLTALVDEGLDD